MQTPASAGLPGPGERISASGFITSISSDCIFIVSNNLDIWLYRTDQLIYVVGKAVIIINQYDHSNPSCDIFDCQNYGSCLIAALFKFFFRNTVCHDSCTGADADLTFFLIYKTDSNTGIKVSGKIKISNRAAINASFALFQFFDDLAGPETSVLRKEFLPVRISSTASIASLSSLSSPATVEPMCMTCEKCSMLIYFSTSTVPILLILPMSFRPRSTSILCSASSFSSFRRPSSSSLILLLCFSSRSGSCQRESGKFFPLQFYQCFR